MNMSITTKVKKRVYVSRLYPPFSPHLDLKLDARPSEAALSLQPKRSRSEVIESLAFSSRDVLYCGAPTFQSGFR